MFLVFRKILMVTTLFVFLIGCKKKLFDYRNKYIGSYEFILHRHTWTMGIGEADTTFYYSGEVSYGDKGKITIDWFDHDKLQFEVNKDGEIRVCHQQIGKFSKKSVNLSFDDDICGSGPNGANTVFTLNGTKK